ncbi:peptidoglycan-binding protein [Aureimonas endophytica]|uniref:peptidoglycan-binding protein n=1 Tax=Aureimonas endophytica TaxID=2027858 RepID=UPI00166B7837|nr:peptidoglycan-binding protein [Aureimonas endophytica]
MSSLSRTLESLEARLASLPAAHPSRRAARPPAPPRPSTAAAAVAAAPASRRPAALADAVSEIVMRRQMLDEMAERPAAEGRRDGQPERRAAAPSPRSATPSGAGVDPGTLLRRFANLASEAETLNKEDGNYRLMTEVAAELQRLREEMREANARPPFERNFDEMRAAFEQLRLMIENRESAEAIGDELQSMSASLARLTEAGADRSTLNTMRSELEELRHLFQHFARETTVEAVGERWRSFEDRYAVDAQESLAAKAELKSELERLRESLRSLAREDQVQAVERRWDAFEEHYRSAPDQSALSQSIREELGELRAKLETMMDDPAGPLRAAEARWAALEERLDRGQVEENIRALAGRMEQIEEKLESIPSSLDLSGLEERIRGLAANFEALSRRSEEADLQNFQALEERLDEISRAIVTVPAFDMAPIERIEARIAALSARIDGMSLGGPDEQLAARIVDLSARVEELSASSTGVELATRIEALTHRVDTALAELEPQRIDLASVEERVRSLAGHLEQVIAEIDVPKLDTAAIESRLNALAEKLETGPAGSAADETAIRSLEAQIERLSESLARVGTFQEDFEAEFDLRLLAIEQRLDEHRETLIQAAREVADETARRMQQLGEQRQAEHIAKLSENLQLLETLSRQTEGRSNDVFEAVHKTLLKIVDRLELIEAEIPGEARAATVAATVPPAAPAAMVVTAPEAAPVAHAAEIDTDRFDYNRPAPVAAPAPDLAASALGLAERARETLAAAKAREAAPAGGLDMSVPIDREEMNRPLEPGSGMPDIGALLERVRAAQRSRAEGVERPAVEAETRAAAREAVKAASEEAEKLSRVAEAPEGRGLWSILSRRRKAIITGVVAVIVALSALPMSKMMLADPAAETASAPVAADESAAAIEPTPEPASVTAEAAPAAAPLAPEGAAPVPAATSEAALPAPAAPVASEQAASEPPAPVAPVAEAPMPAAEATVAETAPADAPALRDGSEATATLAELRAKLPAAALIRTPLPPDAIGPVALKDAARTGNPKAAFEIGLRLMEGRDGGPKPDEALDWFAQAALQGFAPAQYSLGTLYEKGNGTPRDTTVARDWYTLAAKAGNVRAMHNLAVLYATGIDGRSQPEAAARWFVEAAQHGMRDSQYNLGILYARGSGVPRDLVQSYTWFGIVADGGDSDAAAKRDEIGKSLKADELAGAQAAIKAFAPQPRVEAANTVDIPAEWQERRDQTSSIDMTKAVRNIQTILGRLGYDAGAPDGRLGEKTKVAITAFQKDNGLKATGEIDAPLIRMLLQKKNG